MDDKRLKRLHGVYQSQQIQQAFKKIKEICAAHGLEVPQPRTTNEPTLEPVEPTVTIIPPRQAHKGRKAH